MQTLRQYQWLVIAAMVDRLVHHAEVFLLKGEAPLKGSEGAMTAAEGSEV